MKNFKRIFLVIVMMLALVLPSTGCEGGTSEFSNTPQQFGKFTYRGEKLTSFATDNVNASEAIGLLPNIAENQVLNLSMAADVDTPSYLPSDVLVSKILLAYKGIKITSKFWQAGSDGTPQAKEYVDDISGTDFKNLLQKNELSISTGIAIKHLISYRELITSFESQNEVFKNSENYELAPFISLFTYHRTNNQFILQTHNFVEIASSNAGGATCSYLQENEILYDLEGKAEKFQSSLGMKMQTKIGTQYEGTIFSVDLEWQIKT